MINYLNLRTVSQLAKEASPAITSSKLRWWLFHAEENGLNHAIVKIGGRLGNRAKEGLVVDFINQTDLDKIGDKASIIEAFFSFAQEEQRREAEELISAENLNVDAAKRYIANSIRREYASDNGTELNTVMPKMSPLNPEYLTKKHSVLRKMSAFVDKFKGVGGKI